MYPPKSYEKAKLRKDISLCRELISREARKEKNAAIWAGLLALPQFITARSVLLYASCGSEVDTWRVITHCLSIGMMTVLPRVTDTDARLHLFRILTLEDLAAGYRGIFEPPVLPEMETGLEAIDIVVAPGVAFDESCNRLGHGKGFYDKLLGSLKRTDSAGRKPFIAALAFEEQVVPSIYCGPYDIKMDRVITDRRTIYRHGS